MTKTVSAALAASLLALSLSAGYAAAAEPPPSIAGKVEAAKTRADHEQIASFYEQEAKAAQMKSDEHRQLAAQYKKPGYGNVAPTLIQHCNYIAAKYQEAAAESLKMARLHRDMAAKAKE